MLCPPRSSVRAANSFAQNNDNVNSTAYALRPLIINATVIELKKFLVGFNHICEIMASTPSCKFFDLDSVCVAPLCLCKIRFTKTKNEIRKKESIGIFTNFEPVCDHFCLPVVLKTESLMYIFVHEKWFHFEGQFKHYPKLCFSLYIIFACGYRGTEGQRYRGTYWYILAGFISRFYYLHVSTQFIEYSFLIFASLSRLSRVPFNKY